MVNSIDVKGDDVAISFGQDGRLELNLFVPAGADHPRPGEPFDVSFVHARGSQASQLRRTRRALLRIGLGMLALQEGGSDPLHADFDPVRLVLLGAGCGGHLLESRSADPNLPPDLHVSLRTDVPGSLLSVQLRFGGFTTLTSLEVRRRSDTAELEAWADANDVQIFELSATAEPKQASAALRRLIEHDRIRATIREAESGPS